MPGSIASYTARSTTSIATTRSRTQAGSRKMTLKWWERRPILPNAWLIDLQKGSYLASIYSLLQSLLQISLAVFDIYCLIEAAPGSKHFRSFGISFMFVYSGNQHVRRALIAVAIILILCSLYLLSAALILMNALRKEHELKFRHWLRAMAIFITFRLVILIFQSIVNKVYHSPKRFIPRFLLLSTGNGARCWRLRLKYDDLYGRLMRGPKIALNVGELHDITYMTAAELLLSYVAYVLMVMSPVD